ncbi:DNA binding domain-containing protein, excisionase family [Devosia psychrophila]|uniref:DNA binding domain-containing protein, excisionase family n=2 Tax=Devosia psychrophila TaxID=728005 RepID=A0A1I1JMK9_9HYPH|nr:DNA binding domain-containing protein, excisionase family [Devosia psychrophila]
MTLPAAQAYSGLSRSFFYKLFTQGLLRRLKAGKRVLILRADLDAYLESIKEGMSP